MPYNPPSFEALKINTLNLDSVLSALLNRYVLVDGGGGLDASKRAQCVASSLDSLLIKNDQILACDTKRKEQQAVFNRLAVQLKRVAKTDETQMLSAMKLLLGAMLHRYFLLEKEYKFSNSYFLGYKFFKPQNCNLLNAIKNALNLHQKPIDEGTIFESLTAFKNYMCSLDEKQQARYKAYEAYLDDPYFLSQLDGLILEYKDKAKVLLHIFSAITFLQALAKRLEQQQKDILSILDAWKVVLEKNWDTYTLESLCLASVTRSGMTEDLTQFLNPLFKSAYMKNHLSSAEDFISNLKACWVNRDSFILVGAYVLILEGNELNENLSFVLEDALELKSKPLSFKFEERLDYLDYFKNYSDQGLLLPLDQACFNYFGGRDQLKMRFLLATKKLSQKANSDLERPQENSTASSSSALN